MEKLIFKDLDNVKLKDGREGTIVCVLVDEKDIPNYYEDPCLLVEFYDPEFKDKRPEGVRGENDWYVDEVKPSEILKKLV